MCVDRFPRHGAVFVVGSFVIGSFLVASCGAGDESDLTAAATSSPATSIASITPVIAISATTTSSGPPTTTTSTTTTATTAPTTTADPTTTTTVAPSAATDEGVEDPGELTLLVIGDSTGAALAVGFEQLADEIDGLDVVTATRNGCGLVTVGELYDAVSGSWRRVPPGCVAQIDEEVPARVRELRPSVVVAMVTSWDVALRRWDDGVETEPTSDVHRQRLQAEYEALTRRLLDDGAERVAWVLPPTPNGFWVSTGEGQEDDAWQQASRDAFVAIAAADDRVEAVDLAGWMQLVGLSVDVAVRPDGIHLSPERARWIAAWIHAELTR